MFRTSRTGRRLSAALTWMGEWRLSGEERRGLRSEREVDRRMRLERGANDWRPDARDGARQAEIKRMR